MSKTESPQSTDNSPENIAGDYLASLGINFYNRFEHLLSYLRKTYGATVIPIEKFIGAGIENLDKAEFYSTKNECLNLSIDVAAFNYAFYKAYIKWFIAQAFNPKRLLDIGCENGILTNYYAKAYPGAEIIGIDTCANAIKCARELAQKMKLDNVRFEVRCSPKTGQLVKVGFCF